jgi:hypothetical protein
LSGVLIAGGRSILIAVVASGIETMKMIKSTSITSTKGVTLISAFWPRLYFSPFLPPSFTAMHRLH